MTYFMIFVRDERQWSPQFGDRDFECVKQEREDTYLRQRGMGYDGDCKYDAKDIKIVRFARVPNQAAIHDKTFELNMREAGL